MVDHAALLGIGSMASFFFLFSAAGLLTFVLATRPVEQAFVPKGPLGTLIRLIFFSLASLGVYLGLMLRFNTWDLLLHPRAIFDAITGVFGRPALFWGIIAFGLMLWMMYQAVLLCSEGWKGRTAGRAV